MSKNKEELKDLFFNGTEHVFTGSHEDSGVETVGVEFNSEEEFNKYWNDNKDEIDVDSEVQTIFIFWNIKEESFSMKYVENTKDENLVFVTKHYGYEF